MRYHHTIDDWDNSSRIWIFYEATQTDLKVLRHWCEVKFPNRVEFDTQNVVRLIDFRSSDLYRQAFVFSDRNDAMLFKLTWV